MNTIYALVDPRTGYVRYIGVTRQSLSARLTGHLRSCRTDRHTRKIAWIKGLLAVGLKPEIILLEATEDRERECWWIGYYRTFGANLTNGTSGGDGGSPMLGKRHSAETKQKMSIAAKMSPKAVAAREQIHASMRGCPKSDEVRKKISDTLSGRKTGSRNWSEETKIAAVQKRQATINARGGYIWARPAGWKHTEETKQKMRNRQREQL